MLNPPIVIRYRSSELVAVPSRHFCSVFADEVNRLCSAPASRPDAMAVELGCGGAAAAAEWLRELGVGVPPNRALPVMLALVRRNRMIRASLKQKALRLQQETGKDLGEIPSDILQRELHFCSHAVLFLSPVDSIVEAIRCALELGIPHYGIDLEETAGGIYEPAILEDPHSARGKIAAYVARNQGYADTGRDFEIDSRRELAMVARLKALLDRYRRVLFVCGMAHWQRVVNLIADESIEPSPVEMMPAGPGGFRRVVVHPLLAVQQMDMFPPLAHAYERQRRPAGNPSHTSRRAKTSAQSVFSRRLRAAYRRYFAGTEEADEQAGRNRDLESLGHFEGYLGNLCSLSHSVVPDLALISQAAHETMSDDFADAVISAFMDFPWTTPEDHPGCALLRPAEKPEKQLAGGAVLEDGSGAGRRVFIRSIPGDERRNGVPRIRFQWNKSEGEKHLPSLFTWRPWEYLISSLSFRAIQSGMQRLRRVRPVVFEGSMLDGIDMRSTIRSFSRGGECVYVRDWCYETAPSVLSPIDSFPIVWILNPGDQPGGDWMVLHEPARLMEGHVRDRGAFQKVISARGGQMVALIAFGRSSTMSRISSGGVDFKIEQYCGIVIFQPICWTNMQFARWAELTRFGKNPFCRDTHLSRMGQSELRSMFERDHGIRFGDYDWATTLIMLALPFAQGLMTVVVPDGYQIHEAAYERARKRKVSLATAPLKLFSPQEIARLSACHLVPAIEVEPETKYSKAVEKAVGERQTMNRHLVPEAWLSFGMRR